MVKKPRSSAWTRNGAGAGPFPSRLATTRMVALVAMRSNLSFTCPASSEVKGGADGGGVMAVSASGVPLVFVPAELPPSVVLPLPGAGFLPEAVQPTTPRPAISKLTQATMRTGQSSAPARERGIRVPPSAIRFDVSFEEGIARQRDERTDTHTVPAWGKFPTCRLQAGKLKLAPRSQWRAKRFFPENEFRSRGTGSRRA